MNPKAHDGSWFVAMRWLSDALGAGFFCALAGRISELGIVFYGVVSDPLIVNRIATRRLEFIDTDVPAKNSEATVQHPIRAGLAGSSGFGPTDKHSKWPMLKLECVRNGNSFKAAIFGIFVAILSLASVIAQTTTDEAQQQFESLLPQLRSHHPDQYDTPEKLQTAWRLFRQNMALAETARRKGYADTPEIRARLTQMLAQEIILKEAETARPMHAITEAEIREHFATNRDKYDVPTMLGAHEIVFPYDPADTAQSQKQWAKAKEVLRSLANQPVELRTFQELIKAHSDPRFFQSNGGSLGIFPSQSYHGQPPPLPKTAVAALLELKQVGRVTEVLDDGQTLRILRLNAYRPAVSPKLETLKDSIRRELYLQARDSRIKELARESGWDPKAMLTAEQLNRLLRPAQPVGSSKDFPPTPGGLGIPVPK